MRLSLLLHVHCSVPGCDATGAVAVPVEPKAPGAGLGILYAQPEDERLQLPSGWSSDGLCPEHSRPVDLRSFGPWRSIRRRPLTRPTRPGMPCAAWRSATTWR